MISPNDAIQSPDMERRIWRLYREFFDLAEKRRRWSLRDDIPWEQCNPNTPPEIATVVESFGAVELFLPDYVGKFLPMVRGFRGRAWFTANWGYEESKHSMALQEWLLRSGMRTEAQIEEMDTWAVVNEYSPPYGDLRAMAIYTMVQELATWLHYRNLRGVVQQDDPALSKVLMLLAVDERAHFDFYVEIVRMYLEVDRVGTLESFRRVMHDFAMPAAHMLADSEQRAVAVRNLGLFNESIFYGEVFLPALRALGVDRTDLRTKVLQKKSIVEREPAPV